MPDPPPASVSSDCAESCALERMLLRAKSTALAASLAAQLAESQTLARALVRRRAAAASAQELLPVGAPRPLRLVRVLDWDEAYELLAISKQINFHHLLRTLEDVSHSLFSKTTQLATDEASAAGLLRGARQD